MFCENSSKIEFSHHVFVVVFFICRSRGGYQPPALQKNWEDNILPVTLTEIIKRRGQAPALCYDIDFSAEYAEPMFLVFSYAFACLFAARAV